MRFKWPPNHNWSEEAQVLEGWLTSLIDTEINIRDSQPKGVVPVGIY